MPELAWPVYPTTKATALSSGPQYPGGTDEGNCLEPGKASPTVLVSRCVMRKPQQPNVTMFSVSQGEQSVF